MSKFKVGDEVELVTNPDCPHCCSIEGTVSSVQEANGIVLYKVNWHKDWTFDETEIQFIEEYHGN